MQQIGSSAAEDSVALENPDRAARAHSIPNAIARRRMPLKKPLSSCCEQSPRAAARWGRSLRIMFADEARFGRINRPRPCWAPIGTRPEVAAQLIREYIYLYRAVSPKDGRCMYLIMPTSNTACFQAFLDALGTKVRSTGYPSRARWGSQPSVRRADRS